MRKKLCFVLGAGGARGIAHIGFLQAMDDNKIKPDYIAGCSMGAVVGACYSAGFTPERMRGVAESLKFSDIADFSLMPFTKKSIMRSVKMRNKISSLLGDIKFEDLNIPFECIAVDLVTGKEVILSEGSVAEAVCASSAIPMVFRAVEKDGMELVDGGIISRLPLHCIKDFHADVVVAVDVLGRLKEYKPSRSILGQMLRVVDVNDENHTRRMLRHLKPNVLIEPELGDMSQFKVENLQYAYEQGYKAGMENAKVIKKLLRKSKETKKQ